MCVEGDHSNSVIVEEYLKALKRRRYSPKTIATYRYPLEKFLEFFQSRVSEAGPPKPRAEAEAARGVGRLQDVGRADLEAWRLQLVENGLKDAPGPRRHAPSCPVPALEHYRYPQDA